MNKKFLGLLLCLIILPCCFIFTGCKKMDHYRAYVPTDQPYYATLNYKAVGDTYNFEYDFKVTRTTANVAGEDRDVIYIEYERIDHLEHSYDTEYTLIYVASRSFYLEDSTWKKDVSSLWTKWSEVYGAMGKAGTFVELLTYGIWGRDFPEEYKTTTDEYIEYRFKYDEEVFRIANNPYHYLLYYHLKTNLSETTQNATVTFGIPTTVIPHLNTITSEMLED